MHDPRPIAGANAQPEGLICEDNLTILRSMSAGIVDLVYIDPPFGSGQTRRLQAIKTGRGT